MIDSHGPRKPTALILEPSKDLAEQTAAVILELQTHLNYPSLQSMVVLGGEPVNRQARQLAEGVDIITGTPGTTLIFALQIFAEERGKADSAAGLMADSFLSIFGRSESC